MSIRRLSNNLLVLFFTWRIILFLIAFLGPFLITSWGNRFPYVEEQLILTKLPFWVWPWGNFDGVHYLTIAKTFYSANFTQTFFPLYPLVIRLMSETIFLGNFLLAALFVSNISFLGCLYLFRRLLLFDGYRNNLSWIMLFLVFFPTSFYFGSIYTESLFLLLVFLSFYFARKKNWLFAGILGAFASATRLFGLFMVFALLTEYLTQNKGKKLQIKDLSFIALVPLGLLAYMFFLYVKFDDPLLFWHAQPVFGAQRLGSGIILPLQVIYRYFKILLTVSLNSLAFWVAIFEILAFLITIIILIVAHFKGIRLSYLVFSWLSLILPTLTGTFSSLPRYILVIFPIFITLGMLKNKLLKIFILVISFSLMLIASLLFTRGYWVA